MPPVKGTPPLAGPLAAVLAPPPIRALLCRRCNARLHRSRPKTRAESHFWPLLGLRTYRCGACGWRGLRNPTFKQVWNAHSIVRTLAVIVISVALGAVLVEKCIPQDLGPAPAHEE